MTKGKSMNIEADIERLNINSVLHGALLLSLFEAHSNQKEVVKSFRFYAETIGDLALARTIPDSALSAQGKAFQEMMKTLKGLSRKPVRK
jgi:hypothetical protein